MAEFAGLAIGPHHQLAIHHKAAAKGRAHREESHNRLALPRPVNGLRQRKAIRVILHFHRPPDRRFKIALERLAIAKQDIGIAPHLVLRELDPGEPMPTLPSPASCTSAPIAATTAS